VQEQLPAMNFAHVRSNVFINSRANGSLALIFELVVPWADKVEARVQHVEGVAGPTVVGTTATASIYDSKVLLAGVGGGC